MYPWIWIQSVLRKLWLPGDTVFDPIAVEAGPRPGTGTWEFAPQFVVEWRDSWWRPEAGSTMALKSEANEWITTRTKSMR